MNLTPTHLLAILPLILTGMTVMAVMLATAWRRCHAVSATLTFVGLALALAATVWVGAGGVLPKGAQALSVTPVMVVDRYALIFTGLVLVGGLVCTLLGKTYFDRFDDHCDEYYLLMMCSVMGAIVLVSSVHMASLLVGLELMSVPLYGLAAFAFRRRHSLEAGIKYLVLSALATAFLLFGMALLYAVSGTLRFEAIGAHSSLLGSRWVVAAVGMMVIGLAFKLSVIPFHLWTPDVYEGAPMPVTAFLATVSKVAVFAALLRFITAVPVNRDVLYQVLSGLAVLSMLGGNLLALMQNNLKRIMGYSSIAHLGYLMIVVVAMGWQRHATVSSAEAAALYLSTYMLTALGAFSIMTLVTSPYGATDGPGTDRAQLYHYRGLFWRHPYQAAGLSLMMISLAGIPLTAGFVGKFYVVSVAVDSHLWWLAMVLVLGSAIGLYYYLRVMITLFLPERAEDDQPGMVRLTGASCALVSAFVITTVVWILGLYPTPLMNAVGTF